MLANISGTLYVGVTSDLHRRVFQHRQKLIEGFTKKYNVTMLVYFEMTSDVVSAITREKQIKRWQRSKKTALVESLNPEWRDLSAGWYEARGDPSRSLS